MPKLVKLADGSMVHDRRVNNRFSPAIVSLIIFLFIQTSSSVWWASWVTTSLEYVKQEVTEIKNSIKEELKHGRSRMVLSGSGRESS